VKPVLSVRGLDSALARCRRDALSIDIAAGQKGQPDRRQRPRARQPSSTWVTGYLKPRLRVDRARRIDIEALATACCRLGIPGRFQIPQCSLELTAAENLAVAGLRHAHAGAFISFAGGSARRRDKAIELLERFGLADLADRPISELAGGRCASLSTLPWRWSAGLNCCAGRADIGRFGGRKIRHHGSRDSCVAPDAATIVFVEHDMEIVSRYADRVVAFLPGPHSRRWRSARCPEGSGSAPLCHRRRAMNAATPLLEIDHLVVEIQSMPALRGFSMRVARGAMVSLVGRNGAGKTTLMRSIMGHLNPAQAPSGSKESTCRAPTPCPRRSRDRLHAGRPLFGASVTVEENILLPLWSQTTSTARRGSTSSTR